MQQLAIAPAGTDRPFLPQDAPVARHVSRGGLAAWQVKQSLLHIEIERRDRASGFRSGGAPRGSASATSPRAFRVSFGQPPHTYVMARRIERAKRLLLSGKPIPLVEVALCCVLFVGPSASFPNVPQARRGEPGGMASAILVADDLGDWRRAVARLEDSATLALG